MKTFKQFSVLLACMVMFSTCTKSDVIIDDYALKMSSKKAKDKPVFVTVPFKAEFIGDYIYVGPDSEEFTGLAPKCEFFRVIVDFEGNGTHLGKFTGNFDFCFGPEGYGQTDAYMVAANGDILIISISGNVIQGRLDDHPDYVTSYWQDPFEILGGTGRFEGATGGGISDDYNSSLDPNSHHSWNGTITMKKGKRK